MAYQAHHIPEPDINSILDELNQLVGDHVKCDKAKAKIKELAREMNEGNLLSSCTFYSTKSSTLECILGQRINNNDDSLYIWDNARSIFHYVEEGSNQALDVPLTIREDKKDGFYQCINKFVSHVQLTSGQLELIISATGHIPVKVKFTQFLKNYPNAFGPLILALIQDSTKPHVDMGHINGKSLCNILQMEGAPSDVVEAKCQYLLELLKDHTLHYSLTKRWLNRLIKLVALPASINGFTGGGNFAAMLGVSSNSLTIALSFAGISPIAIAFLFANIPKDHVKAVGVASAAFCSITSVMAAYNGANAEFNQVLALNFLTAACSFLANVALDTRSYAEALNAIQLYKVLWRSSTPKQKLWMATSTVGLSLACIASLLAYIVGSYTFFGEHWGEHFTTRDQGALIVTGSLIPVVGNVGMFGMIMMIFFRKKLSLEHAQKLLKKAGWVITLPSELVRGRNPFNDLWLALKNEKSEMMRTTFQGAVGSTAFIAYSGMTWATVTKILIFSYAWGLVLSGDEPQQGSLGAAWFNDTIVDYNSAWPGPYSFMASHYPVPSIMNIDEVFGTLVTVVTMFIAGLGGIVSYESYARFGDNIYSTLAHLVSKTPVLGAWVLSIFRVIRDYIGQCCFPRDAGLARSPGERRPLLGHRPALTASRINEQDEGIAENSV